MTGAGSTTDDPMGAPHRPGDDWRCRDDAEEWPCPVFRRRMWSLYRNDRRQLVHVMRRFRDRAEVDLNLTAEQANTRFTAWIEDPPAMVFMIMESLAGYGEPNSS